MSKWTDEELKKIESAEELNLSSFRADGTLRNPVTMWVVRVGDDVFVRSVKGRTGPWFRGTQTRHKGRINAGGVQKDVLFMEEPDSELNEKIDAVYSHKYHHHPKEFVDSVLSDAARASTIRLVPQ